MAETYLGDGLYASYDGFMFILRAPRSEGDHWVGLEPSVLRQFIEFTERMKNERTKLRNQRHTDATTDQEAPDK